MAGAIIRTMHASFKTVALIGKYKSSEIGEPLLRLAKFLVEQDYRVLVARQTGEAIVNPGYDLADLSEIGERADVAIVMGGDGTMLNIARNLVKHHVPLIGINQGRLGFLTDVSIDTMLDTVGEMLRGDYTGEDRILLSTVVRRNGASVSDEIAFNDVVVSKGSAGRLIEFEASIDGQFVYSQRSDGLVVATPTGSTAYALSSGGPILHPTLEAMVMVPICPHTLSARPIAVNSRSVVEITLTYAADARVHFDGQHHFDLNVNDKIVIQRTDNTIRLLHPVGHSYYDTLRQKLHWGEKL